jgi:hypothetical protein
MLALEANHVIVLRLSKMAFGGPVAHSEAKLMITEKIDAAGRLGGCCSLS